MIAIKEVIDIVIITLALGYIFMDFFKPKQGYAYFKESEFKGSGFKGFGFRGFGFDWKSFSYAAIVAAPAVILHELAHKFVAVSLGFQATFHAAYFWLLIGIIMKLMNFGFIFFVPAYVSIMQNAGGLTLSSIAFAGPAMNLLLFLGSWLALRNKKGLGKKAFVLLYLTKQINLFLFAFNMLPITMFDGLKVYSGVYYSFFG